MPLDDSMDKRPPEPIVTRHSWSVALEGLTLWQEIFASVEGTVLAAVARAWGVVALAP